MKKPIMRVSRWLPGLGAVLLALLLGIGLPAAAPAAAEESALPGMCSGRSDPLVVLTAHAVGAEAMSNPKFVLNLSTDAAGQPTGTLVSGQGASRLEVTQWCRLWQHVAGEPTQGDCDGADGEDAEGATIVHAVGIGHLRDGTAVLVRVDARGTGEGDFYRLRYRPLDGGGHEGAEGLAPSAHEDGGCGDDEGWTRIPSEGWLPLTILTIRAA